MIDVNFIDSRKIFLLATIIKMLKNLLVQFQCSKTLSQHTSKDRMGAYQLIHIYIIPQAEALAKYIHLFSILPFQKPLC